MTKLPVLDDCTRDANVIGYASSEAEAAEVFMSYHRERMDADDFAELAKPAFAYRTDNAVSAPCYEPLF